MFFNTLIEKIGGWDRLNRGTSYLILDIACFYFIPNLYSQTSEVLMAGVQSIVYWLFKSCDLSQAEKNIIVAKAEQTKKMTI